jgi:hypothetical protein
MESMPLDLDQVALEEIGSSIKGPIAEPAKLVAKYRASGALLKQADTCSRKATPSAVTHSDDSAWQ